MKKNYVDKQFFFKVNQLSSKTLIENKKSKLSRGTIKNISSISKFNENNKKFNLFFKNDFDFSSPIISNFKISDNILDLWVRTNSYFILCKRNLIPIQIKNLVLTFKNGASITDQTGGQIALHLEGKECKNLKNKQYFVLFHIMKQSN